VDSRELTLELNVRWFFRNQRDETGEGGAICCERAVGIAEWAKNTGDLRVAEGKGALPFRVLGVPRDEILQDRL
jgi:hypothetical protein